MVGRTKNKQKFERGQIETKENKIEEIRKKIHIIVNETVGYTSRQVDSISHCQHYSRVQSQHTL